MFFLFPACPFALLTLTVSLVRLMTKIFSDCCFLQNETTQRDGFFLPLSHQCLFQWQINNDEKKRSILSFFLFSFFAKTKDQA